MTEFRPSGQDEYPNLPNAPTLPKLPSMTELDYASPGQLIEVVKVCVTYAVRVDNFIARLQPFVGGFNRLDGMQQEIGAIKAWGLEAQEDLDNIENWAEGTLKEWQQKVDAWMEDHDNHHKQHEFEIAVYNQEVDTHNKALGMKTGLVVHSPLPSGMQLEDEAQVNEVDYGSPKE